MDVRDCLEEPLRQYGGDVAIVNRLFGSKDQPRILHRGKKPEDGVVMWQSTPSPAKEMAWKGRRVRFELDTRPACNDDPFLVRFFWRYFRSPASRQVLHCDDGTILAVVEPGGKVVTSRGIYLIRGWHVFSAVPHPSGRGVIKGDVIIGIRWQWDLFVRKDIEDAPMLLALAWRTVAQELDRD